jgi:hypothetical protein
VSTFRHLSAPGGRLRGARGDVMPDGRPLNPPCRQELDRIRRKIKWRVEKGVATPRRASLERSKGMLRPQLTHQISVAPSRLVQAQATVLSQHVAMTSDATAAAATQRGAGQQAMLASQRAKEQQAQQQKPSEDRGRRGFAYFPLGYKEAAQQWVSGLIRRRPASLTDNLCPLSGQESLRQPPRGASFLMYPF